MSTQEPSYFETDQLCDQSQNQPPDESQKDAEMASDEMSTDVSPSAVSIEFPESTAEVASGEEVPADDISPLMPPAFVRIVPAWRPRCQSQRELRTMFTCVLVTAAVVSLTFIACMGYLGSQKLTETYFFAERAHQMIVINNDQGSISIHCQSRGPFGFRVERYSQGFGPGLIGMDVVYTQYGAVTIATAHMPPNILFVGGRGINMDVSVPAFDKLKVHTGKGSITLKGRSGDVVAMTDNGSLAVENCQGSTTLRGMQRQAMIIIPTAHSALSLHTVKAK